MKALIRLFRNICLFKQGPEDVPSSVFLLALLIGINFVIELLLGLSIYSIGVSSFLAFLSIVTLSFFSWVLLNFFKFNARFIQTLTAFTGVNLFTNIFCFLPVTILWKMDVLVNNSFGMVNLFLLGWILSIYAHIFKRAINISFFLGLALAITYFISFSHLSGYILGTE
ncbi:MAG: hypothetical protein KZQ83_09010 [gamma proteobacterium symbiont of Taylorina sp.]|nr:hypothetical protein [gamma proteobacterium symbiont of Taylorina sp.]